MGWVLNTQINDIYTEDTVQGNVHRAFEPSYPKVVWYVSSNPLEPVTMTGGAVFILLI